MEEVVEFGMAVLMTSVVQCLLGATLFYLTCRQGLYVHQVSKSPARYKGRSFSLWCFWFLSTASLLTVCHLIRLKG